MEVVEGDKEGHQENEDEEKDGKTSGYGVLTTEILHKSNNYYHESIQCTYSYSDQSCKH